VRALNDEFTLVVRQTACGTCLKTGALGALRVVAHPLAPVDTRRRCAARHAHDTPLALPGALRYFVQRRIEAIDVEADVALVAQDQPTLVVRFAATLAHRAVQAAPAFLQHRLRYLRIMSEAVLYKCSDRCS